MKHIVLGLFGRLFILFSVTTVLLSVCVLLGVVNFSEEQAMAFIKERQTQLSDMLTRVSEPPVNRDKLEKAAKDNRVDIAIEDGDQRWTTAENFPSIAELAQNATPIGELLFSKHQSRYYLLANSNGRWSAVTSNIANLIVYPSWLVYWPWILACLVVLVSYYLLRVILRPVREAVRSAQLISQGNFEHQITSHPSTELADLTKGLNRMASELKARFEAKNDLLMSVSHEVRTPLGRMKVWLAMLDENEVSAKLSREIDLVDTLVDQLLESERLEKGANILSLSHFFLPSLINDIIHECGDDADSIKLISEVPDIVINIDVGRVKFVLRNLLQNSLWHSGTDTVQLSIETTPEALRFIVKDEGRGIPPALLERVFEPFFQVDQVMNRTTKGTGLGLFLCQRIAQAHHGSIVINNLKPGCECIFSLPASCMVRH
ncbi:HAMP domain-containing sensor histidine kinase [Lacimicrobium sp. SS2-24]|uniref:HAMP domain-containing sensor histidine kinase n=1 Tax=Lacimicrobium sp. SS2-24 TaxID=2005569 RepID=UPI000B4BA293|nr:HAMP domain-containing sensor histidine kinase [Lacimicrobium sp. SS2-24]